MVIAELLNTDTRNDKSIATISDLETIRMKYIILQSLWLIFYFANCKISCDLPSLQEKKNKQKL